MGALAPAPTGADTLGSPTWRIPVRGPLLATPGLPLLLLLLLEKLKLLGVPVIDPAVVAGAAVDTLWAAAAVAVAVAADGSGALVCALLTLAYRGGSGIWKPLPGLAAAYAAAYAGSWLKLQRSPFRHVPFSKKKRHGLVR